MVLNRIDLYHPKSGIFLLGGSPHGAAAAGVMNDEDGNPSAAQIQEPIEDFFPFVGIVLFYAAEKAGEVIENQEFDIFFMHSSRMTRCTCASVKFITSPVRSKLKEHFVMENVKPLIAWGNSFEAISAFIDGHFTIDKQNIDRCRNAPLE
jgi:hypothetical protein